MKPRPISLFCQPHLIIQTASIIVLFLVSANLSRAQDTARLVSIADAEKMSLGTAVTIEGTVTVASGTFKSSFDDEGFQLEDRTGGMYITIKTDLHLIVGQKVRLSGKRTETALKFQIIETDESHVHTVPGRVHLKPIKIKTGNIVDDTVGRLIKVIATVTKPVDEVEPYGFRVSMDDGSGEIIAYVSTSTGIAAQNFVPGQKMELIGIAGKFNDHYQIYPRSLADIRRPGIESTRQ